MGNEENIILTVNAGSSSLKAAVYSLKLVPLWEMTISDISLPNSRVTVNVNGGATETTAISIPTRQDAANRILEALTPILSAHQLLAIGHRVVHGGEFFDRAIAISDEVIYTLQQMAHMDPEHTAATIECIEIFRDRFQGVPEVACFDTAFYRDLPEVAQILPIPYKFKSLGLRRFGFHGLSYQYLIDQFEQRAGAEAASGRVIIAHLGSGASLTAMKDKNPVDTTMSFSPVSGIPMSTRSGDLDPSIASFLHSRMDMSLEQFDHMVHAESGLLGISELSGDMELLINQSHENEQAALAIDVFCHEAKKAIGGLTAVLGGIDSLIFSGGIGENAPLIRENICQGLEYLGIKIDSPSNQSHQFLISSEDSKVGVHVMATEEAQVIAKQTLELLRSEEDSRDTR